jgi:hypothetical protein
MAAFEVPLGLWLLIKGVAVKQLSELGRQKYERAASMPHGTGSMA